MQADSSTTSIAPAAPEPFALVVGRIAGSDPEASLRRMGLRPEPVREICAGVVAPAFRLHLGSATLLLGPASTEALASADPDDPATSLLAVRLPAAWRADGQVWTLVPEGHDRRDGYDVQAQRLREFFKMAVLLIDLFDASHIFWSPARLWSDAPQFRSAVAEMLISGMPPVLHLVAFRRSDDPGVEIVRTRGLALFGGQEIESRIPSGWTVAEMVKRLARLALDVILHGPVTEARHLRGLGPGEWVSLTPESGDDGRAALVRVEFGSDF